MGRSHFMLALGLVALVGCGDKDGDEDSGTAPDLDTDTDEPEECSGTAPVIDEVTCENTGIQPHYETGEDTPTMQILATVDDEDGDLTFYRLELFFDDEVDGSVDTSSSVFTPVDGALDVDECEGTGATLGLTLYLTGGDPAWDTEYEWGVVVSDAASLSSDVGIVTCYTPKSDGSDGGEEDTSG